MKKDISQKPKTQAQKRKEAIQAVICADADETAMRQTYLAARRAHKETQEGLGSSEGTSMTIRQSIAIVAAWLALSWALSRI